MWWAREIKKEKKQRKDSASAREVLLTGEGREIGGKARRSITLALASSCPIATEICLWQQAWYWDQMDWWTDPALDPAWSHHGVIMPSWPEQEEPPLVWSTLTRNFPIYSLNVVQMWFFLISLSWKIHCDMFEFLSVNSFDVYVWKQGQYTDRGGMQAFEFEHETCWKNWNKY